ncbi:MAG: hypothetical protein ABI967_10145 [bacterium]
MPSVSIESEAIRVGEHFSLSFKRTLRIPDDGTEHQTPPNFGVFPIYRVSDYADRLPESWRREGGVFIPMYQREALYLRFENEKPWQPCAVKVALGQINAVSGERETTSLSTNQQDYLVCPPQLWLDGINSGRGSVRQFIAMPLGTGATVEGALSGKEEFGGVQITIFAPKPGAFPDSPPAVRTALRPTALRRGPVASGREMGLGAGGTVKEKILPDPHGVETWDQKNLAQIHVRLLNSAEFREVTGLEPPATTVNAETYRAQQFPWFPLYGEAVQGDVAPAEKLAQARTIADRDAERKNSPAEG